MSAWTIRLPFDTPPMSSNDQRRAHWSEQARAKEQVTSSVAWLCKQQKIPKLITVRVCVTWFPKDRRRRDADSLGPLLKGCLDGMVLAGVLADDSHQFVPFVAMGLVPDPADPRIELNITEVAA